MAKGLPGIDRLRLTRRCTAPSRMRPRPGSMRTEHSPPRAPIGGREPMGRISWSTSMSSGAWAPVASWGSEVAGRPAAGRRRSAGRSKEGHSLAAVVHGAFGVDPAPAVLEHDTWLLLGARRRLAECHPELRLVHVTGCRHQHIEPLVAQVREQELERRRRPAPERVDWHLPRRRAFLLDEILDQALPGDPAFLADHSGRPRYAGPGDHQYDESYPHGDATKVRDGQRNHQQIGYGDHHEMALAPDRLREHPTGDEGNRHRRH